MYKNLKITVCLPCRNEAGHLKEVVDRVPPFVDEIIVISNNSSDDTVKVAQNLGVNAIEDDRVINGIGYGYAHMTGIANATGDIIVGADGDATYPIEDLASIIDHLLDDKLDFISCNRYPLQKGTHIPFKLRFGVWALNTEVRLLYNVKVQDILSGMWVFRSAVRTDLNLSMGEWNLSPQIKINAATNPKIAFGEFSIAQHQRMGASHQKYFRTGISHMVWIFKNRLASLSSLSLAGSTDEQGQGDN